MNWTITTTLFLPKERLLVVDWLCVKGVAANNPIQLRNDYELDDNGDFVGGKKFSHRLVQEGLPDIMFILSSVSACQGCPMIFTASTPNSPVEVLQTKILFCMDVDAPNTFIDWHWQHDVQVCIAGNSIVQSELLHGPSCQATRLLTARSATVCTSWWGETRWAKFTDEQLCCLSLLVKVGSLRDPSWTFVTDTWRLKGTSTLSSAMDNVSMCHFLSKFQSKPFASGPFSVEMAHGTISTESFLGNCCPSCSSCGWTNSSLEKLEKWREPTGPCDYEPTLGARFGIREKDMVVVNIHTTVLGNRIAAKEQTSGLIRHSYSYRCFWSDTFNIMEFWVSPLLTENRRRPMHPFSEYLTRTTYNRPVRYVWRQNTVLYA